MHLKASVGSVLFPVATAVAGAAAVEAEAVLALPAGGAAVQAVGAAVAAVYDRNSFVSATK